MPIRVTFLGSLPPFKGVSPYCVSLATALAERGDVDLEVLSFRSLYPVSLYPGRSPVDPHAAQVDVKNAPTRRVLTWWNPLGWVLAGLTMRGEVVHAQWWSLFLAPLYVTVLACARARGKPVIITVHNALPHEGGLLSRWANRIVLRLADRIIVHAEQNRRALVAAGIRFDRIDVVPMGVPPAERLGADEARAARCMLGIPEEAPVVLFLGNIRPYKGLPCLLDAFRSVVEAMPEATLVVAGQPWCPREEIEALIEAAGLGCQVVARLDFLPTDEMRTYYAAADVVVYPYTHFDAQSAAACDALRYGKAIIVTHVGGLPELVDDERAVVPVNDASALARSLMKVLADRMLITKLEGDSLRIASSWTWDDAATRTATVYQLVARDAAVQATAAVDGR